MKNSTLAVLIRRNITCFFREKGLFLTSLITPVILLVLYTTFLANIYHDSFVSFLPEGVNVAEKLIDGVVAGQLISSLLAVSCVTVAFSSNMLSVQDKADGQRDDFAITPVKSSTMALAYYIGSFVSTLIVIVFAFVAGMAFIAVKGWYLTAGDLILSLCDVLLLTMFGTALSTVINFFLSSRGQISAVGSIVSSGYGFICGAYMPISNFSAGLQHVISFLPGTYGTGLLRNHLMSSPISALSSAAGFPAEASKSFLDLADCNLYFFGDPVSVPAMYAILGGSVAALIAACVVLYRVKGKSAAK